MFSMFWVSYVLWPPCGKLDVPKQLSEDFQSLARSRLRQWLSGMGVRRIVPQSTIMTLAVAWPEI